MLRLLGKILLSFLLLGCLWLGGLLWFAFSIPSQPADESRVADAIVVLTGGNGRIEHGLELLAQGKGKRVFISGVHKDVSVLDIVRQAAPGVAQTLMAGRLPAIEIGNRAENTIGNAEETAQWVKKKHIASIRLVTANYHMPRSVAEFEEKMPDIAIFPAPVFPSDFSLEHWWQNKDSRELVLSEYHKLLAGKLRHWFLQLTHKPA